MLIYGVILRAKRRGFLEMSTLPRVQELGMDLPKLLWVAYRLNVPDSCSFALLPFRSLSSPYLEGGGVIRFLGAAGRPRHTVRWASRVKRADSCILTFGDRLDGKTTTVRASEALTGARLSLRLQ